MTRVPFTEIDGAPYRAWWRERFAPAQDPFAGMRFYQRGRSRIWVGTAELDRLESTRTDAVGIHLLRISRRFWKPTSAAIVAFGATASTNFIEMSRDEAAGFFAGDELLLPDDDPRRAYLDRGFVAARYRGVALGCAEWHARGALVSLIPRNQQVGDLDF